MMPNLSHRNTRRYSDEGRERALRAAGKHAATTGVQGGLPPRSGASNPRRR